MSQCLLCFNDCGSRFPKSINWGAKTLELRTSWGFPQSSDCFWGASTNPVRHLRKHSCLPFGLVTQYYPHMSTQRNPLKDTPLPNTGPPRFGQPPLKGIRRVNLTEHWFGAPGGLYVVIAEHARAPQSSDSGVGILASCYHCCRH